VVSQWPFQQRKNETTVTFNDTLEVAEKTTPYKLRAVVVHQGKAGSGHYIAYVRCADDRWYKCDDSLWPKLVPLSTVLLAEAYMLFYDA
jgi:ubiquitin carboxyl-terminal hydrolase 20/33